MLTDTTDAAGGSDPYNSLMNVPFTATMAPHILPQGWKRDELSVQLRNGVCMGVCSGSAIARRRP